MAMVAGWRCARTVFSTGSSRRRQRGCTAAGLAEPWISLLIRDGRLVPVRSDTVLRAGDEAVVLSADPDAAGLTALFAAPAPD